MEKNLRDRNYVVMGDTLPEAYHEALTVLFVEGLEVPCPNYNTKQKEVGMEMIVNYPTQEPMLSRCAFYTPESLEQYRQEMLDGILDFEVDYGNWEYTYHRLMEAQIPWVIDMFAKDIYSRQAAISLPTEETRKLDSPPCLQNVQYLIRPDEKGNLLLHCDVLFRSNDAVKATFSNAFALIMLQQQMARDISSKIGQNIEVGQYVHKANSFHVYENDYEMLKGYANRIASFGSEVTYDYIGDWDEQMADTKEDIAKKVLQLKNNPQNKIKQVG